jgi:hypothetical protein
MKDGFLKRVWILAGGAVASLLIFAPGSYAALIPGLGGLGSGGFSFGLGAYQAPNDADSDSGMFALARLQTEGLQFELDYGLTNQDFLLGAADYLYSIPTAEGITQTSIALGGGATFVLNDPGSGDTEIGPNALAQIKFMGSYSVQLRYDLLGGNGSLWTFGLSYAMN